MTQSDAAQDCGDLTEVENECQRRFVLFSPHVIERIEKYKIGKYWLSSVTTMFISDTDIRPNFITIGTSLVYISLKLNIWESSSCHI